MLMQVSRQVDPGNIRCAIMVSVSSIIEGSASVNDDRVAHRKVCNAIEEAARAGIGRIEIALTLGDSPLERFMAHNAEVGRSTAQSVLSELRAMIDCLPHFADRVHYAQSGPVAFGVAIEQARAAVPDQPLAVMVPHQMRGLGAAYLREMLTEYVAMNGGAAVVAGSVGMDALPCINWLACRGRRVFARSFTDAADVPCDLSELRLTGRCILPPIPAQRCSRSHRAFARAASLPQYLNRELASARRVIAREFSRRDATVATPNLRTIPVCPNPA